MSNSNEQFFEGTNFSKAWVRSYTSAPLFIAGCPEHICAGLNREVKLTQLWEELNPTAKEVTEDKKKK